VFYVLQRVRSILAHNKLTLNTGFNENALLEEFDFLRGLDFNTQLTGFLLDEIEKKFAQNGVSKGGLLFNHNCTFEGNY
jgi:hypothetical protein